MKTLKDVIELLKAQADMCTASTVAQKKYQDAPLGSKAKLIWLTRWSELADAEADMQASMCTNSAVAWQKSTDTIGSYAKEIWEARFMELEYGL